MLIWLQESVLGTVTVFRLNLNYGSGFGKLCLLSVQRVTFSWAVALSFGKRVFRLRIGRFAFEGLSSKAQRVQAGGFRALRFRELMRGPDGQNARSESPIV